MNREEIIEQIRLNEEIEKRQRYSMREFFNPSVRQLGFFYSPKRFTMFSGSNQSSGKTSATKIKTSYHLDGKYPRDREGNLLWKGKVFSKPVTWAMGGVTANSTRDNLIDGTQTKPGILGPRLDRGSGAIPRDSLDLDEHDAAGNLIRKGRSIKMKQGGTADQVDYFDVKWHRWNEKTKRYEWDGKSWSRCYVFEYSSDWKRLQGYTLDGISLDEEPPFMVFYELQRRLIATGGLLDLTLTPLEGYTEVIELFERKSEENPDSWKIIYGTIRDAHWMTQEQIEEEIKNHSGTFLESAVLWGRPNAGEGMIYKTPHDLLVIDPITIPDSWPRIIGIDIPHTTGTFAATWWAWDKDTDTLICYDEFKAKLGTDGRAVYKDALLARHGDQIPIAWPHDAGRASGFGQVGTWVDWLKNAGLNVCSESAYMMTADGQKKHTGYILAILDECSHRMQTGRLKIQSNCQLLLKEMSRYGSENGLPKKKQDDHLIDSMHKAVMMADDAQPLEEDEWFNKPEDTYDFDVFLN